MDSLDKCFEDTIWVAHTLFMNHLVTGSTGNISFAHDGKIYMSGSGTCFGTLAKEDFSVLSMDGQKLNEKKPSKEFPLHMMLYQKKNCQAVIHTHSFYSTLWSCCDNLQAEDCMPDYTPYLRMKVGNIGLIPYEKPGSQELFDTFRERLNKSDGYLLAHHGPILDGKNIMDAFYKLCELEESAHIVWELKKTTSIIK